MTARRAHANARRHARHLGTAAAVALALAGCGGSSGTKQTSTATTHAVTTPAAAVTASAGSANSVTATAGAVTATMRAQTHRPKAGSHWVVSFTVMRAGSPARASVEYEYLFGGQVVAHRSHYVFVGHFTDVWTWPASATGYPLTVRAVIVSGTSTINLDYDVQVLK